MITARSPAGCLHCRRHGAASTLKPHAAAARGSIHRSRRAVQALAANEDMQGKTVWMVTGAGRGLGLQTVKQLLVASKDNVVIAAARKLEGQRALTDLHELGGPSGRVHMVQLDMADPSSIEAAAKWVQDNVGQLDVLINNAGVVEKELASWDQTDAREGLNILTTNTLGPLLLSAALVPIMKRTPNGRKLIAHLSSQAGSIAAVETNLKQILERTTSGKAAPPSLPGYQAVGGAYVVYRASKAALNMEMLVMARDLAPEGFTVVSLHPGFVATDLGNASARAVTQLNRASGAQVQDLQAPVSPQDSVAGLLTVLQRVGPADSGKFLSFDGTEVPF